MTKEPDPAIPAGSGSSVAGSGSSEEPGYPTLPGSSSFGPTGPKERLFWPKAGSFWPEAGFGQLPWFPDPGGTPRIRLSPDPGCCTFGVPLLLPGQEGAGESRRKPASSGQKKPASWPKEPASGQRKPAFWPEEAGFFGRKKPAFWPKEAGFSVYSRVFPVFPGITVFPGIPGIPGCSRYSRCSRVFP